MTLAQTPQSRCRFGIATGDITPPVGMYHRMWGAAKQDVSTGVHRPLRATVAVFQNRHASGDDDLQLLASIDHCILGQEECRRLIQAVTTAANVPEDAVLIVCSHTHAAGILDLSRAELPGGELLPDYFERVCAVLSELTRQALHDRQPAWIVYGTGKCDLAAHRDFFDAERGQYVCGFNPGHPADDTLLAARVQSEGGETLASIVNYACHPTTLAWENSLISPDYPGAMRELIERETQAPCLFLQGASGELGPREGFVGDPAVADRNGRQLGYAALATLTAQPQPGTQFRYAGPVISGATLGSWKHEPLDEAACNQAAHWRLRRLTSRLPYRTDQPSAAEWEQRLHQQETEERQALQANDAVRAAECRALAERARRALKRVKNLPPGDEFPLQAALWRIGDAVWLGVQGEPYSLLQTELRRRFPDRTIIVAAIAFTWDASYLPPAEIYGQDIYQQNIAVVAKGGLERLLDDLTQAIRALE